MEEIYAVADRITVLRDGKKIGTSEAQLLSRSNLVKWMVGRDMDEQFPHRAAQWGEERLRVEDFTVPDPGGSGRPCVDGVSFSVRSGEIVGLGGLQGSGASELLNAIFGTYGRRIHGSIFVDGTPVASGSPRRSLRHGIALLTNDRKTSGLVLGMTVRENVTLASVEKVSPGTWMQPRRERRIGRDTVESLGVRCRTIEQPVETLSGGNQQKIVLGKWLNTDPRVLLLDEPTRGVDVGAKHEIYELMHKCTESGIAIVLITSEMPELLALSDRILVMHRGRIATELHRDDASPEAVLRAAMGQSDDSGYPKSSTVKRDSTTADPTGEPR